MLQAKRCTSYSDFVRVFSGDTAAGQLANYVKLFFLNGGSDCYVMRIANGASQATVGLQNEAGKEVLKLIAKDAGLVGENIRAVVTYNGPQPEVTFNLDLFRWEIDSSGNRVKRDAETWKGMNMDPASPLYAPDFITQNSKLVSAEPGAAIKANDAAVDVTAGVSFSGRLVPAADLQTVWQALITAARTQFRISVDGSDYIDIDLTGITVPATPAGIAANIEARINTRFANIGLPAISVTVGIASAPTNFRRLSVTSNGKGDVFIRPASQSDLAVPMMLGTAQGGIEVSGRARRRPAASGITYKVADLSGVPAIGPLNDFADLDQAAFTDITLEMLKPDGTFVGEKISMNLPVPPPSIVTVTPGAHKMMEDAAPAATSPNGNGDGVREKLAIIAQRINGFIATLPALSKWRAEVWGSRLAIIPTDLDDNFKSSLFATTPAAITGNFIRNVHYYTLGKGGNNIGLQTSAAGVASDGNPPKPADYDNAYEVIDKDVDLFNLMVLPPDANVAMANIYPKASIFCQQRRAFLLMDPPTAWDDAQKASTGVAALRIGLVKDFSAIFFPRVTIDDNGKKTNIGASGAIAGLCARIDGTRGVWKAPAGTEADLRGVVGLEYRFSDRENGILNPRAINTIRIFPNGIVNWGARTMDGDDDFGSEYKYIPIRRLALFIEESLYRGLKWVVFEPNDEPLYAQIRLNVGAFMHNLFRQGAFQGQTPRDAYFVKCDKETTTQNDRNLGIVNIWVGFAPLKPAEFVILYLQQMAGQIEV
ncbi:MAG: phage tail sheath C-terminal domain-containing protein [Blastocatellia bacterium]